ncbi:amidohydrolase family protein [Celeribacter indicus]|uniref:Amidohydrolase-related domain-containing protein n=1 Tax=Celeribacter indicus TaxID=1208324 RepID=A0A0B5EA28_9RHOB|nr:amidohydrolase family protein [Celeribacter indicus]AJE49147.1 hypothetical protein P73_4432 [Celeribacter indicus]SDX17565.1 Predicted metal-dependent hydrolase, TIM-barrel fold [Celeribacter indicus]
MTDMPPPARPPRRGHATSNRGLPPLHEWDDDWLALTVEEVIDPDRPIVDAHHHLWQRKAPYFLPELLADLTDGHRIRATVYMECSSMYRTGGDPDFASLGEIEYVNGVAAEFASGRHGGIRACAGIVGRVDLRLGDRAREVLLAAAARAPDRFRGIRQMAGWDADPEVNMLKVPPPRGLLGDGEFRRGFAHLAPLGLSFDAHIYHPQIPELLALADAFPDTVIVVDHIAGLARHGPYARDLDETFRLWRDGVRALAERPNLYMKIGGLAMRGMGFDFIDRDRPPRSDELAEAWRPFVETCIAAFGPARCMFESNFPVDRCGVSYRTLWNTYKRLAAGHTEAEKTALFAGTACRAYRLAPELAGG